MKNNSDRADLAGWRRRNATRRSNAAQPIPAGQHKAPRSMVKQQLREEHR